MSNTWKIILILIVIITVASLIRMAIVASAVKAEIKANPKDYSKQPVGPAYGYTYMGKCAEGFVYNSMLGCIPKQ